MRYHNAYIFRWQNIWIFVQKKYLKSEVHVHFYVRN